MFSLNSFVHHVFEHKTAAFDPKEGESVSFNHKGQTQSGVVIKRQGQRIRVDLGGGSTVWSDIKEVVSVEGSGSSGAEENGNDPAAQ